MRIDSNRFVLLKTGLSISCHAVFAQINNTNTWNIVIFKLKYTITHAIESYILCRTSTTNSYAMHTIKITPKLLFEYQCTSGKFIRLPNRIKSKLFCPNWNALAETSATYFSSIRQNISAIAVRGLTQYGNVLAVSQFGKTVGLINQSM